jgi:hypothetical protein
MSRNITGVTNLSSLIPLLPSEVDSDGGSRERGDPGAWALNDSVVVTAPRLSGSLTEQLSFMHMVDSKIRELNGLGAVEPRGRRIERQGSALAGMKIPRSPLPWQARIQATLRLIPRRPW